MADVNMGKLHMPMRLRRVSRVLFAGLALVSGCNGGAAPPPGQSAGVTAGTPLAPRETELDEALLKIFPLITQGRYGAARVRLKNYMDEHPEDGKARFLFGLTYHRERQYRQARAHFERSIELTPGYAQSYYFLGWASYYLGDMPAARRGMERMLAYDPDLGDAHFVLGLIAMEEHDLAAAEARFRRAIELQADDPARVKELSKAHARLGDLMAEQGRLVEARAELERSVSLFPDHYEAYFILYRVLVRLDDAPAAEQAMEAYRLARARVRGGT